MEASKLFPTAFCILAQRWVKINFIRPINAEPLAKNRLFTQYHAQYPESERSRIVEELVQGTSTHRVLFVTIAFGLGIDCNDIRRVVHIGVPYSMEDYCQEVGRAGRDGLPARADIYYNSYDISRSRKNMTDVMRNYVKSKECKRKMILNYFDHKVPSTQGPAHMCCDFLTVLSVLVMTAYWQELQMTWTVQIPGALINHVILQEISQIMSQLLCSVRVFKQKSRKTL